ncbi:MAG: CpcT/CpeT family chromophore lyase [Phycisphaerales bacterium JB037]
MTRIARFKLSALALLTFLPGVASAQQDLPPPPNWVESLILAPAPAREPWSSESIARVGEMLEGSWKSAAPVAGADPSDSVDILMHIARVKVDGHRDVMYLELARIDQPDMPYRQALLQLIEANGQMRLRTYEVASQGDGMIAYAGAWAAYEWFPANVGSRLIATMDIMLEPSSDGYAGKTRHPYATALGGALDMTSSISIEPGRVTTHDQGFDAAGNKVWGQPITFQPYDPGFDVIRDDRGLVYIDYNLHDDSETPAEGDAILWAFQTWLHSNARLVGDSDFEEVAIQYAYPLGRQFLAGLRAPLYEAHEGRTVRAFLPAELAYGNRGWKVRMIPENEPVIYYLRCVRIESLQAQPAAPAAPAPGEG